MYDPYASIKYYVLEYLRFSFTALTNIVSSTEHRVVRAVIYDGKYFVSVPYEARTLVAYLRSRLLDPFIFLFRAGIYAYHRVTGLDDHLVVDTFPFVSDLLVW